MNSTSTVETARIHGALSKTLQETMEEIEKALPLHELANVASRTLILQSELACFLKNSVSKLTHPQDTEFLEYVPDESREKYDVHFISKDGTLGQYFSSLRRDLDSLCWSDLQIKEMTSKKEINTTKYFLKKQGSNYVVHAGDHSYTTTLSLSTKVFAGFRSLIFVPKQ